MAGVESNIVDSFLHTYSNIFVSKRDTRVDDWFLMSSPWPTLTICLSYVLLVKVIGPRYMQNRQPFDLRQLLVLYNGAQVIFSAWLFYEYGRGGWFHGYSFTCQPVDYSSNEMAIRMLHACWWYYFSKYTEFFDTIFFVLRKKSEHVSLLHVIHHGCMPMSVWFGVKFTPGGHSTFFGLLNTFVHIIMYFYYMVSAMGPKYQKYIWWKKHLTSIQMYKYPLLVYHELRRNRYFLPLIGTSAAGYMGTTLYSQYYKQVQFVLIATHAFQLLFIECDYPKAFVWWIGSHGVLFLFLFSNFYTQAYNKRQRKLRIGIGTEVYLRDELHLMKAKSLKRKVHDLEL